MLGGGGVSHPFQLTTGLVVNSFITTSSHLGRWVYASYSLVSIRKNVFYLKQNFILSIMILIICIRKNHLLFQILYILKSSTGFVAVL